MIKEKEKVRLFNIICPNSEYSESNLRFNEILYMIDKSGLPTAYIGKKLVPEEVDYPVFIELQDIQMDIKNFVEDGKNMYIYSNICGNGKTTWSVKLMMQYFSEVWASNCYTPRGLFIHVPTFLTMLKYTISNKDGDFDTVRKLLTEVDIVIWDDIASTKLSEFDYNHLLTYIDFRTVNGMSNIYTGNILPDNLPTVIGNRLASRMKSNSTTYQLHGTDRR